MRIARAALHHWEEPPISGTSGSGTIFFSHCSLGCIYCQNRPLAAGIVGWEVDEERLAAIGLELQRAGALNINLVTPTHYRDPIISALREARAQGLHLPVLWNTSGYERADTLGDLRDTVQGFLTDYKYADGHLAQAYSQAADYPKVALEAIEAMVETVGTPRFDEYQGQERLASGVVVRHLLLPGALDNSEEALETLWDRFGDSVLYSLMNQYTPLLQESDLERFPELSVATSSEDYEALLAFADDLGMEDYFWQHGPTAVESFIPSWDGEGVFPSQT